MTLARSRLTAQGQILDIRQKLGLGPGSILEWEQEGDKIMVRRAGQFTSEEIHRAVFPQQPPVRAVEEMKEGLRRHIQERQARR